MRNHPAIWSVLFIAIAAVIYAPIGYFGFGDSAADLFERGYCGICGAVIAVRAYISLSA